MPFSKLLAGRVRDALSLQRGMVEKRMFGGVGFLLNGNMLVGVWADSLIVRVGPDAYAGSLQQSHVKPFDITGRPMKGWILVEPDGVEVDAQLTRWIDRAIDFVSSLPAK